MRRSYLTLRIFRRLLSPQGLEFRCPTHSAVLARNRAHSNSNNILRAPQRRSLWGFSRKAQKQAREAEFDPGLETMLDLSLMKKMNTRPPPNEELVTSWKKFFAHKRKMKLVVNNVQAKHVLTTFRHLKETNTDVKDFGLDSLDLIQARDVLRALPTDGLEEHVLLSKELYQELLARSNTMEGSRVKDLLYQLIYVLSRTGHTAEAKDTLLSVLEENVAFQKPGYCRAHFFRLISGFAREDNEAGLLSTLELSQKYGESDNFGSKVCTAFYAKRNNIPETKRWYEKSIVDQGSKLLHVRSDALLSTLLKFGIRNDELDWCRTVFRDAINSEPGKKEWDVILQWAAGAMGKGVEDVEQMMKVMTAKSTEEAPTAPDSETINGLIEMAMEHNDPYTAERFIELGRKLGINPNAHTYIQQMRYRAAKGDLSGTQSAYEKLQAEEISGNEDLPAINEYLRALCKAHAANYTRITSIMSDLEERDARLEASTTGALSIMYMERDELHDALDVLQANSWHYTLAERDRIRESFTEFILNPNNETARAWDAYTIMREVFNEASRDVRTLIMNEFFRRQRCDMACYTFGHMRQNIDVRIRPVAETYVYCLQGIAFLADSEQLDMVHNMLKMDSSIEPSSKLYNALMLAYAECGDADRAVDFWDDITNSAEGPTYNSLVILFRACEMKPFAEKLAMDVWDKMKRMDIEVTRDVFIGYMAALAGRGQMNEAKRLVESMEQEYGFEVDVQT